MCNQKSILFIVVLTLSGCVRGATAMPDEWGELKTDENNACLRIDQTFRNEPVASEESGYEKGKTLSALLFPVMKNIDVGTVKIETADAGIAIDIKGNTFKIAVGEQGEEGKVTCTQRTWVLEQSEFSSTEGSTGVINRAIYLYLNQDNDLIVREVVERKGVGLLVVPYGEQDTSFYKFEAVSGIQ